MSDAAVLLNRMHSAAWSAIQRHGLGEDPSVSVAEYRTCMEEFATHNWRALLAGFSGDVARATAQLSETMGLIAAEANNKPWRPRTRLRDLWPECKVLLDGSRTIETLPAAMTRERPPSEWEIVFDCSWDTIRRRIDAGELRGEPVTSKRWKFSLGDVPSDYDDTIRRYSPAAKSA